MTENEAIEELKYDCNEIGKAIPCDTSWGKSFENAYAMAINALKEVQQYRAIGTPEELKAAMKYVYLAKKHGTVGQVIENCVKYEAIGTVEEFREAVDKQTAKKVTSFNYHNGTVNYGCPVCKRKIISKIDGKWCGGTFNEYCDRCGQKLDWRVNDENTD